ncbi:hypothetical protein D9757_009617 [Collybiopsis confluens]|uniref:Endoplasmic reticulum-Golgi intermediate compartment protein 3 n=1 Tax=Collybiopsis confluens TaxID=2823264 RepID=A0A8H5GWM3_9AGAR|nr:hypothetical protein D9757_009617 [Collybiopsis confluens]
MAKGLLANLKGVDAFGKTTDDVKVKTRTGAFLTILSAAIILSFTFIEYVDYRRVYTDTSLVVDKSRGEKLTVRLNVTFPRVPCYLLSLDVMDISGETQRDISHNVLKTRLETSGKAIPGSKSADLKNDVEKYSEDQGRPSDYCGSCYGGLAPGNGCCNTCEEVRTAYINKGWTFANPDDIEQCKQEGWKDKLKDQANEGCNVAGPSRAAHETFTSWCRTSEMTGTNTTFHIRFIHFHLKASDDEYDYRKAKLGREMKARLGLDKNPLDGTVHNTAKAQYMFQYFLKVVSTQFRTLDSKIINSHQFSVTHFERDITEGLGDTPQGVHLQHGVAGVPGAFFNFEISPILVVHTDTRQSFAHFMTSTCAIVGGVLTVASLFDSVLFATSRALKKQSSGTAGGGYGATKAM